MYTDASFMRRPQAHLPLSGSSFDLCNDVFLDSYNEPEPVFVADATPGARIWDLQMYVNAGLLLGGIRLGQQAVKVPESLGLPGVLEGLVLGENVDEALADVVAVLKEELPTAVSQPGQDVPDLALGGQWVRHSAGPRRCGRPHGGRAIGPGRPPAARLRSWSPGTTPHPPGPAPPPA